MSSAYDSTRKTLKQIFEDCQFTTRGDDKIHLEMVKEWLTQKPQDWKGNNLVAESEYETVDWVIAELLEDLKD